MKLFIRCLFVISIFLQSKTTESQNLPPTELVKITHFNNTEGLYYKFLDKVKITTSDWKLINYLDLSEYTAKYLTLSRLYNTTSLLCSELRQKINNSETTHSCQLFAQATIPHLHEIDRNHQNILSTIGNNVESKIRNRRGLRNAISRAANILYGSTANIDFTSIFNKIAQLAKSQLDNMDVIPEQTRIVKSMIKKTNDNLNQILINQQKLEQNIQFLGEQTKQNTQNIDQLKIRTMLLEQTLFFEVLLNQYAYETQNLLAIVNSALQGIVHTSILNTQRWLSELREIKAVIPVGTTLPLEITTESISDCIKISEITIVHKDHYLLFIVKIPLAQTIGFNAYNVIPLPIIYDDQNLALIDSNIQVLAISYDTDKFFSMTQKQWETCKALKSYTLCRNSQPTHNKVKTDICEITLISKPQNLPENCKVKLVSTNACVWNRLPNSNSWLFYAKSETITIYCENPIRTFNVEISGVGRLTIATTCNIHTDTILLTPSNHIIANTYADLVPENPKFNIKNSFKNLLTYPKPQNISNVKIIKDLKEFTNNLQEMNTLGSHSFPEPQGFVIIHVHLMILYISIICIISLSTFIVLSLRKNKIKLYKPDLGDTELSEKN